MAPIVLFVLLAYAVSWAIWWPLAAAAQGWIEGSPSSTLHLWGAVGPLVAAVVVSWRAGGVEEVRRLAARAVLWRIPVRWHVVAVLAPVALYFMAALAVWMIWGAWPDVSRFGRSTEFAHLPLAVYWLGAIVLFGWGEETGWRGFLLPRLQRRMSALSASLVIAPIWAVWHLPLFLFVDGYVTMGEAGGVGWLVSMLTGSILMTWLFNSAWGSVWIVAVFHGVLDIVFNSPSPGDLAFVLGVLITAWALGILVRYGPRDLAPVPRLTSGPGTVDQVKVRVR